jgi:hypothetical protein
LKVLAKEKRYKDRKVRSELSVFDDILGIDIRRLKEKERYYIEHQGGCVFHKGRSFALTFMS